MVPSTPAMQQAKMVMKRWVCRQLGGSWQGGVQALANHCGVDYLYFARRNNQAPSIRHSTFGDHSTAVAARSDSNCSESIVIKK